MIDPRRVCQHRLGQLIHDFASRACGRHVEGRHVDTHKFQTQNLIYTTPMVLFGIFRYLYLIYREVDEVNPTESMLRDVPFVANGFFYSAVVLWIVYF